jgi:hypothetical protein
MAKKMKVKKDMEFLKPGTLCYVIYPEGCDDNTGMADLNIMCGHIERVTIGESGITYDFEFDDDIPAEDVYAVDDLAAFSQRVMKEIAEMPGRVE